MPTLHLLLGYPGAGKTTFARQLRNITKAVHLSSDKLRLEMFPDPTFSQYEHDVLYTELNDLTKMILEDGEDVVYDANLNRLEHREEKYKLATDLGVSYKLWWIRVPRDLARTRRIGEVARYLIPDGETPERMFDRVAEIFESPKSDEKFIEVDGTKITEEYVRELLRQHADRPESTT